MVGMLICTCGICAAILLNPAWNKLRQRQHPHVSMPILLKASTERRDSIHSLHCSVELLQEDFTKRPSPAEAFTKHEFAHSANTYYRRDETFDESGVSLSSYTYFNDGKTHRQYGKPTKQAEPTATISPLEPKQLFFPDQVHPLPLLLLLNSPDVLGSPFPPFVLAAMIKQRGTSFTVLEHPEVCDNVPCTIMTTGDVNARIDVAHGHLLRKIEYYSVKIPHLGLTPLRSLVRQRSFKHFSDVGNGLFLPQLITTESYSGAAMTRRDTAKIT